nr:DNA polymerase III subunit delta [Clostridium polynesiense]
MIDIDQLENKINKKDIRNCYILTGIDEHIIKEQVDNIISACIHEDFRELNVIKMDGMKLNEDSFIDACETLPFMSEKKVVVVYRAAFLKESQDSENKKRFQVCQEYIKESPSHCVLIFYYIFEDKREKVSDKVKRLEKYCTVVKADKLKGEKLYKKVGTLFQHKGKEIGKVELKYFCDNVENNMDIIANEADKLINFTEGRNITRNDIDKMLPYKSENDVFDLVDFISQKNLRKLLSL